MAVLSLAPAQLTTGSLRGLANSYLCDLNPSAVWAGITTFIWYAVGLVPVQIAVTGQFGLSAPEVSSWIFIIWFTGAVASIALSLVYRQPIPITSTIPGLIFLGSMAGLYNYPELIGASLMAGVLIVVLGMLGMGARILRVLPMPLAMGMLAGSVLGDVTHMVSATVQDAVVAGATVAGYAVGRLIRNPRIPPVGLALIGGGIAVLLAHRASPAPIAWALPSLVVPHMQFSASAFVAVSIPLVVLSMALGNVQGLGFLMAQGYKVSANKVTLVLGVNSIVNAFLGGHTAIVSRNGMPIMAGPEAGPVEGRYWANLIAAALTLLIALAAAPVALMLGILPSGYVVALAGLAILPSLQNALEKAFEARLRFGAVVALVVSATSFSFLGIGSGFWALIAALLASLVAEREDLMAHWRGKRIPLRTPRARRLRNPPHEVLRDVQYVGPKRLSPYLCQYYSRRVTVLPAATPRPPLRPLNAGAFAEVAKLFIFASELTTVLAPIGPAQQ